MHIVHDVPSRYHARQSYVTGIHRRRLHSFLLYKPQPGIRLSFAVSFNSKVRDSSIGIMSSLDDLCRLKLHHSKTFE